MQVEINVVAINVCDRLIVSDTGELVPIVDLLDEFGDICLQESEAVCVVCGPTVGGKWFCVMLSEFAFDARLN